MDLTPMLASVATDVPVGDDWVSEPKWDGMRTLVRIAGDGSVRIESRRGHRWTGAFPELAGIGQAVGRSAVLDGETVVMGESGRPDFALLSARLRDRWPAAAAARSPATFVAFDLLELDGEPVMALPWAERRELLVDLAFDGVPAVPTMVCDDGEALFAATRELGVEGVMAKRRRSRYVCGPRRTNVWVKIKHKGSGWFDVAGWRLASRERPAGGIVLADEGQPAGTALCCLPADQRAVLHDFLARHGTRYPDIVRAAAGAQVHVEFLERSPTGLLREAVARQLRAAVPH